MTNFDIIGAIRTYCETLDYIFIAGDNFYINADLSKYRIDIGKTIITALFTAAPEYSDGQITRITYNGVLTCGVKVDSEGYSASLDESFIQKYDRRLLSLMGTLSTFIQNFMCDNALDVTGTRMLAMLNRFAENIDYIEATLTFIQEP